MMDEASGTEKAYSYYEAGAPKVTEAVIAGGLEEAKTWIRESIEMQRKLVAQAGVHAPIPAERSKDRKSRSRRPHARCRRSSSASASWKKACASTVAVRPTSDPSP